VPKKSRQPECHMFGKINVVDLVQNLTAKGITDARVEEPSPGNYIIHLVIQNSIIRNIKTRFASKTPLIHAKRG
jgi:hypothetical protein